MDKNKSAPYSGSSPPPCQRSLASYPAVPTNSLRPALMNVHNNPSPILPHSLPLPDKLRKPRSKYNKMTPGRETSSTPLGSAWSMPPCPPAPPHPFTPPHPPRARGILPPSTNYPHRRPGKTRHIGRPLSRLQDPVTILSMSSADIAPPPPPPPPPPGNFRPNPIPAPIPTPAPTRERVRALGSSAMAPPPLTALIRRAPGCGSWNANC